MFDENNSRQSVVNANQPSSFDRPQTPQPQKPKIKTTGKLTSAAWAVLIILILVFGSGMSALAYNFFVNTPEKVFNQAVANSTNFNSGTITYQIEINSPASNFTSQFNSGTTSGGPNLALTLKLKSDFIKENDFTKNQTEINLEVPVGQSLPLIGSITVNPKISLIFVDKDNFYLKVAGLPTIPFFDLSSFNDQWIKINLPELQATYGLKITLPTAGQSDQDKFKEVTARVGNLYQENNFLILKKLKAEKIDGVDTFHYQVSLDKDNFARFLTGTREIFNDQSSSTAVDSKKIEQSLNDLNLSGEVWITKRSKIFKKAELNITSNDSKQPGSLKVVILLTNINQPIVIEAPTQAKSLSEVMSAWPLLIPAPATGSLKIESQSVLDADVDGLADDLEKFYGTDPKNPDTDGDGYFDGAEVQGGYNPNGPGKL